MRQDLLLLELNELNLECVEFYCHRGQLPGFARLLSEQGWARTTSEATYHELEPWIQWVTAHTGKTLAEHGVYRLGDIVTHDIEQIWERLEAAGLKAGAISPMNANNRLKHPCFFVPDPWTKTQISARPTLKLLFDAISQAVDDNATTTISLQSVAKLLLGALRYARLSNYPEYLRLARASIAAPWRRALFLDLLLSDVFMGEVRRTKPHFASLFLNAGAHLQHHYYFSAACYDGPHRNPQWYLGTGVDPLLEIYSVYDRVLSQVRAKFPASRVMVATGLRQLPHDGITFYWRLKDHAAFLRRIKVPFKRVEPRMSRDFLLTCKSTEEAAIAAQRLGTATAADGIPLFEVDNRGDTLFVMLTYPNDIAQDFTYHLGDGQPMTGLRDDIAFVALKNGKHDGLGYFSDTGTNLCNRQDNFPLAQLPQRIAAALDISLPPLGST